MVNHQPSPQKNTILRLRFARLWRIYNLQFVTWLAFSLVILIAFALRFYRLADLPLGIFFDPAINGLDAHRLLQRGGWVIFFPTNGGRESLFMYIVALSVQLFGATPLALRLPTAAVSLLTVALLFGFLKSVGSQGKKLSGLTSPLWLAVVGSLTLTTLYWHIFTSRLGQRPILVPLVSVPIFWFLLKGWATGGKKWFILSGLCLGLAGHTYPAARLLPLILVVAVLPEFWPLLKSILANFGPRFSNPRSYAKLREEKLKNLAPLRGLRGFFENPVYRPLFAKVSGLLWLVLAAVPVYLPMAWYMLTHPAQFSARAGSVMVWSFLPAPTGALAEIGRNTLRVLGFFGYAGSPNPIFGLPEQPGLSPLLVPFLLLGLVITLKNWRDLFYRLIAVWWLIGIAPSALAIEAPHPLRMIVAIVPTAILVALGLIAAANWLTKWVTYHVSRITYHSSRLTQYVLPLLLILATVPATVRAYFVDWPSLPVTQGIYDYNAVAIRDAVLSRANDETPLYLPFNRFNDSTLLYYLGGSFQRQASLNVTPAAGALVISPEKNITDTTWVRLHHGVATLLPPLTAEGQRLIQSALSGDAARPIQAVTGETAALSASLPTDPARYVQPPTRALTATFGAARLTGVNYPATIDPAAELIPVTLYWQAVTPMNDEYEVVLHLLDDERQVRGNGSGRPADWVYPTTFWRPGLDDIAAQHQVMIENAPLPPGRYWLAVALFDPAAGRRLPLTAGAGESPDTLLVGPLKVALPPPPPIPPLDQEVIFGDTARLAGAQAGPLTIAAGETVNLTLLWAALAAPERDYTIFIHLLDANNVIAAGFDSQPLNGRYPTSIWTPSERLADPRRLPTPATLPPGQYRLAVGLYYQPTGERLPLKVNNRADDTGRFILPWLVTVTTAP